MYRRPKFVEILLDIRQEMAEAADFDVDLFAEMVRSGHNEPKVKDRKSIRASAKDEAEADAENEIRRSRG